MVVEFKNRISIGPIHLEEINHTRVMKAVSLASTKMNLAPAIGTMKSSN